MRGYPRQGRRTGRRTGSIPADAGLPRHIAGLHLVRQVYPRGCGATLSAKRSGLWWEGLSPRMRGYPAIRYHGSAASRSIPADAGLPQEDPQYLDWVRVYPRGCGATGLVVDSLNGIQGLSPRMRGYLIHKGSRARPRGSIPADAGLPYWENRIHEGRWVYPRGCGATGDEDTGSYVAEGLSPRMRGYHKLVPARVHGRRSIPADAGLPTPPCSLPSRSRVYPRGCGATAVYLHLGHRNVGLSPRMRGYPCSKMADIQDYDVNEHLFYVHPPPFWRRAITST